ncbi:MAG: 23S rRNA (pseudouridine(1915)-N(3))-methyltransferase RlmH [Erysipelotrichaceae bacterium]|nr:23S rRNA (pseudouridine(1915)-N(3))-methyltransferase RlmH [Erysipelotrichaceae bacterium]
MIKIIGIGKIKDKHLEALIEDYTKKISRYHKIEVIEVKDEPIKDDEKAVLDVEASRALSKIKDNEYVILLDLHGKTTDSVKFAKHLDNLFITSSHITFVIGGSLGLGEALLSRANERLKLSDMTFLHGMTRLILVEQIYRSFKILNNETYHK